MIWLVLAALRESEPELFASNELGDRGQRRRGGTGARFSAALPRPLLPPNCRAGLVFEACGGQGHGYTLVQSRKGSANFRVSVEGRAAHAGSRFHEGANAILELAGWCSASRR